MAQNLDKHERGRLIAGILDKLEVDIITAKADKKLDKSLTRNPTSSPRSTSSGTSAKRSSLR